MRGDDPALSERIDDFWSWWGGVKDEIAASIPAGELANWSDKLSERVAAIDDKLAWEFGPGERAEHSLCLSPEADLNGRLLTERWVSAAPQNDPVWEFYPARQPREGTLSINGVELPGDSYRADFVVDETWKLIHVELFNPRLKKLPEDAQSRAVMLFLDGLLGEDGVERWIGEVSWQPRRKLFNARHPVAIVQEAEKLAAAADYAVAFQLEVDGKPCKVSLLPFLKPIDHLDLSSACEITVDLAAPTDDGLCSDEEAEALDKLEDELDASLGEDVMLVGRETRGGKRITHYQLDADGPSRAHLETWCESGGDYRPRMTIGFDPEWSWLRQYR